MAVEEPAEEAPLVGYEEEEEAYMQEEAPAAEEQPAPGA